MHFCTACGEPILENSSSSCPFCAGTSGPAAALVWTRKIPLISNLTLIRDFFLLFMGIGFLIATILVIITWQPDLYFMFFMVFGVLFILCLIIMFALEWRYGGGLPAMFIVSSGGVSHHAGKEMRLLDHLSTAGSAAGFFMAGTGAGLIAQSQEDNNLAWSDVKYVRVYSKLRFIELRSKYLVSPVVLYCTEENFSKVLDRVKKNVPWTVNIRIHA